MARFQLLTAQSLFDDKKQSELVQSMSMILLRMDRSDEDYDRLVEKMDEVVDGIESRRAGDATVKGGAAPRDLLLICQDILKREWDVTKAEMNRTPLIWPFDRKASAALEAKRKQRVAAVAQRRNGKPAAVPRHLNHDSTSVSASRQGRLAQTIKAVVQLVSRA